MLFWLLTTALAVAALLAGEALGRRSLQVPAKVLASCGFLALALAAGALGTPYGRVILAALVLSWLGDVCLLSAAPKPFLAGLVAFLLAHLVYALAFALYRPAALPIAAALALLALPAALVLRWLRPHLDGRFRPPVVAYVGAISTMLAFAAAAVAAGGPPLLAAGAAGFYLSDLAVARDRFIAPGFANRAWGLPLYYAAQLCLAASVRTAPGLGIVG